MSLDNHQSVLSISRSQTMGSLNPDTQERVGSRRPRLQRIASNGNFMDSKRNNQAVKMPRVPLQRSQSIDTGSLGDQLRRTLSLNEVRSGQGENMLAIQPPRQGGVEYAEQTPVYGVLPPSPYLQPQAYMDHQQHTAQHVVNSIMTPIQTSMTPHSPSYSFMLTPTNYAMSPMYPMYRSEGNYFFPSPYSSPQTPINTSMQNFQLPSSGAQQIEQEGFMRTVSMNNQHNQRLYAHTNPAPIGLNARPQQPQEYFNYNEEQSPVERMLEELRLRMKTTNSRGNPGLAPNLHGEGAVSWGLKEISGKAFVFAKDQFGSRFIQQQLQNPKVEQAKKDKVFDELAPYIPTLCEDVFGNYVIQKLLEIGVGTKQQHNFIYRSAIKGNMFNLSKHMYGCRVIQKLVEVIFGYTSALKTTEHHSGSEDIYSTSTQDMLLMEITDVSSLVTDQNGNHVIQKCISSIKPNDRLKMFYDTFKGQYSLMSKHPYGCRVVQRVLENADLAEIYEVVKELQHHLHDMIQNQYANYVVQHIIQRQKNLTSDRTSAIGSLKEVEEKIIAHVYSFREQLYELISANVLLYSKHKFGSNVVECSIKHGLPRERSKVINRILDPTCLVQMMQDQYANYVVQKVIDNASQVQKNNIINIVSQNELALRRLTFGKHIINKLKSQTF